MECLDAKLKIQSLVDNEIDEKEIQPVLIHMESCYVCRNEYIEMMKIQKALRGIRFPEPQKEWFELSHPNRIRRFVLFLARIVFIFSFLIIIGWAIDRILHTNGSIYIKMGVFGLFCSLLLMFIIKAGDRFLEYRQDKYKGIMK